MASNNSGRNRIEVPHAREALNRFKYEVASELGVPLKQGYNGDLTSAQNGSVGGEMVRRMIRRQQEQMAGIQSPQDNQTGAL
ncbi:MAG: alpha/beta-type small acid-soluble spore protein [Clostridiales bacterium]|nr:alpha/beta-type small acid-soluble spore protein [Clostridiales bacterium]